MLPEKTPVGASQNSKLCITSSARYNLGESSSQWQWQKGLYIFEQQKSFEQPGGGAWRRRKSHDAFWTVSHMCCNWCMHPMSTRRKSISTKTPRWIQSSQLSGRKAPGRRNVTKTLRSMRLAHRPKRIWCTLHVKNWCRYIKQIVTFASDFGIRPHFIRFTDKTIPSRPQFAALLNQDPRCKTNHCTECTVFLVFLTRLYPCLTTCVCQMSHVTK